MQTNFSLAQLANPGIAEAEKILRACVHCGFCTATCPTYVMLGDELDSPRGRIYLIKDMLENDRPGTPEVVKHIDRCLSCLSCMTTCPSGVHYMHLVDHARAHIETTYRRPLADRFMRELLARVLPNPRLFRLSLWAAMFAKPFATWIRIMGMARLAALLRLAPAKLPSAVVQRGRRVFAADGARKARVCVLSGCANPVLAPSINESAVALLNRHGVEVVLAEGEECCGALVHHMGREAQALDAARANVEAWTREIEGDGLDAILITASGCGTTVKDYGFMLRNDSAYARNAARVSALTLDVTQYVAGLELRVTRPTGQVVAYHAACSMQHAQRITREPKALLAGAGFVVRDIPEGHLCCGSAGTYNILQPALADRLRDRKIANIQGLKPDLIATGNLGCMAQLAAGTSIPVAHIVELLDWVTGGRGSPALADLLSAGAERRHHLAKIRG